MKKVILCSLFGFSLTLIKAQVYAVLKTYPYTNIIKNFNAGFEFGKDSAHNRLNFHIFRQTYFPISFKNTVDRLFQEPSGSYNIKGYTYRIGYKIFFTPKAVSSIYIESQVRFGSTSGIYNTWTVYNVYSAKSKTNEGACLLGVQAKLSSKWVLDIYIGAGYADTKIVKVLTNNDPKSLNPFPIGQVSNEIEKGFTAYLGTSIGFVFGKNKKQK